jgi:hypothetical protein
VLEPYADKYGVALINSQRWFIEYVKDFVRAAMWYTYLSIVRSLERYYTCATYMFSATMCIFVPQVCYCNV